MYSLSAVHIYYLYHIHIIVALVVVVVVAAAAAAAAACGGGCTHAESAIALLVFYKMQFRGFHVS